MFIPNLNFYQAGDELTIRRPGDTVLLSEKPGSLLLFRAEELNFGPHEEWLGGRARNCIGRNNFIYIGDMVLTPKSYFSTLDPWIRPGRKTLEAFEYGLHSIGLDFGLQVPEWWPDNGEALAATLPDRSDRRRLTKYLEGVIRPSGVD